MEATAEPGADGAAGRPSEAPRRIVVIGASAGGVEALQAVVSDFPPDLDAAVLVVLHVPSTGRSLLPEILSRSGPLPAAHVRGRARLESGRILVAPPDYHVRVEDGWAETDRGPRENGHRPAVDPLFRSAAAAKGPRVIGVILSGERSDGTLGLAAVVEAGGISIVQENPTHAGMATSALRAVPVDHLVPLAEVGPLIARLAREEPTPKQPKGETMREPELSPDPGAPPPTALTCPDCGGALWELDEGDAKRFRCHIGHSYSDNGLLEEQRLAVERAILSAVTSLEERAGLLRRLASRFADHASFTRRNFEEQARAAEEQAETIRRTLLAFPEGEVESKLEH